jgi:hypothetical protein
MKKLLTAEVEGYKLTILVKVNNENFCFPTYFINGDEVNLETIKPIFRKVFDVIVADYCEARNYTIYNHGSIDLRKQAKELDF